MRLWLVGILWSAVVVAGPKLTVKSHTASEAGFTVNSHLISGEKEAILVDAQFTRSEARKVAELVANSGKTLKAIFITHAHPDHYFGLEILTQAFPKALVLATPDTVKDIKATAQGKLDYWKAIYKDDLTDKVVVPTEYKEPTLTLGSEKIELVTLGAGESEHATALYIPSTKTLVAGDLIFGEVHLWLAENRPSEWIANLNQVRKTLEIEKVLSGHGVNGGKSLIDENQKYIEHFVAVTVKPTTKEKAKAAVEAKYGKYQLPVILDLALDARLK